MVFHELVLPLGDVLSKREKNVISQAIALLNVMD
jgi:hypothetical protein